MSKSCFRLFWSYDVQKTEKWLSEMSSRGYYLEEVDFNLRIFKFELGNPKKLIYRINYSKIGRKSPARLGHDNWKEVAFNKHWHIIANEKEETEISFFPAREEILKRNRIIMNVACWLLAFFII